MSFFHRYDDREAPRVVQAARDLLIRTFAPAAVWFFVLWGLGWMIMVPLHGLPAELAVNRAFVAWRAPTIDAAAKWWSWLGSTNPTIVAGLLGVAITWIALRRWWVAIIPAIALLVESFIHFWVSIFVDRPRPDVPRIDGNQPTGSFPSGHSAASVALYFTFALLAQFIPITWLRRALTVVFLLVPVFVVWSRLHTGMHHLSDVVVGVLHGLVCLVLAWGYLAPAKTEPTAG